MSVMSFLLTSSGPSVADGTVQTVADAIVSALTGAGGTLLGIVAAVVPVVIPVMIGITAVGVGIRVFRKVTGARS